MPRQDPYRRLPSRKSKRDWAAGDISFLRHYQTFNEEDTKDLIDNHYLPRNATCHPVIVLAVRDNKAIVTPVSAFSTESNNFLPPWKQECHQYKKRDCFRSFVGTRRANKHPELRLADDSMKMPKPQASWVYIGNFYCVPFSVLGVFDKSPTLLRVHTDSVAQLKQDMSKFGKNYKAAAARFNSTSAAPTKSPVLRPSAAPFIPTTTTRRAPSSCASAAGKTTWSQIASQPPAVPA